VDLKGMEAAGLTVVAKVRDVIPPEVLAKVEETLTRDSPLAKQVMSVLDAAGEQSEAMRERAAEVALAAKEQVADLAAVAREKSAEADAVAKESAVGSGNRRGVVVKVALGTVVAAAAVGAAYTVWKRRKAAAVEHLSGEGEWATPPVTPFMPGVADEQSPDTLDKQFAEEIDEAAEELATEFVDAVEGIEETAEAPAPEAPFVPGVADEQSPDVVDEQFAKEVDAAADELAADIVEAIEEPRHHEYKDN
jgi:hypothetical protein